jgi:hypothetical protein
MHASHVQCCGYSVALPGQQAKLFGTRRIVIAECTIPVPGNAAAMQRHSLSGRVPKPLRSELVETLFPRWAGKSMMCQARDIEWKQS